MRNGKHNLIITNAFSLNMVQDLTVEGEPARFESVQVSTEKAAEIARDKQYKVQNAIGHADTANIASSIIAEYGTQLPVAARATVLVSKGDTLLTCQYSGTRLPEGATTLPEGAKLIWILTKIS